MRMSKRIAGVFIALFPTPAVHVIANGLHDDIAPAAAILIPGSKVKPDGKAANRFKTRLDRGAELFCEGMRYMIAAGGGRGSSGPREALVMADYFLKAPPEGSPLWM